MKKSRYFIVIATANTPIGDVHIDTTLSVDNKRFLNSKETRAQITGFINTQLDGKHVVDPIDVIFKNIIEISEEDSNDWSKE